MNAPSAVIKCRARLGKLQKFGIEASRPAETPGLSGGPDAMVICEDGRAWLAALWAGTSMERSLFAAEDGEPSFDEVVERLRRWRAERSVAVGGPAPQLIVLAPLLAGSNPLAIDWVPGAGRVTVLPKRVCDKTERLAEALRSQIGEMLDDRTVSWWRSQVAPDLELRNRPPRKMLVRETGASAAPWLLDYKQERCVRLDLEPDPDIDAAARNLNVRLVSGVAGCGKTLVLLHRAGLLARHFPAARILLVTHNRPLACDLQRRLRAWEGADRVTCQTFCQWLQSVSPPGEVMSNFEVCNWVRRQRQQANFSVLANLSDDWCADELAWMCDHGVAGERYLEVDRKGRRRPLGRLQREDMLRLLTCFRNHLRATGQWDWSEWPLRVLEEPPPNLSGQQLDHVLIDEAQLFSPVALRLLRAALKQGGHFFLCADRTQRFLRRRVTWADVGLEVKGRTLRLERPYRSTCAILEFARDFFRRRLPGDSEPVNLPGTEILESLEPGVAPVVRAAGPRQDLLIRLGNELDELRRGGVPPGDILILAAGRKLPPEDIVQALCARLGRGAAALVKDRDAPPASTGVAHLMAATGLERPLVFLLGLDELIAEERNPALAGDDREEKQDEHTRLIYVGLTRAMERLVIYADDPALLASFGSEETQKTRCA